MQKLRWFGLMLPVFLLLCLVGCSRLSINEERLQPSTTNTNRSLLPGPYDMVISGVFNYHVTPPVIAQWELILGKDSSFSISRDSNMVVTGWYYLEEGQITFEDGAGFPQCSDLHGWRFGIYEWQFIEDALVLSPIQKTDCD